MVRVGDIVTGSPRNVAGIYAVFGVLWILTTDQFILVLVDSQALTTQLQMLKGTAFVVLSAGVVYGMVATGQATLQSTNRQLEAAVQQTSILHRVIRHNLRNTCNIIGGHAELLADEHDELDDASRDSVAVIAEQNEELIAVSEKTRLLRQHVGDRPPAITAFDLHEVLESHLTTLADQSPSLEYRLDVPESLAVESDRHLPRALYELLENAIEYNDSEIPTVEVIGTERPEGGVTLTIKDNGPGLPARERAVLQEGHEDQMFHSRGLGLWLAKTIIDHANGRFHIEDSDEDGTTIQISLPADPTA